MIMSLIMEKGLLRYENGQLLSVSCDCKINIFGQRRNNEQQNGTKNPGATTPGWFDKSEKAFNSLGLLLQRVLA